jgi:hypothetical protein
MPICCDQSSADVDRNLGADRGARVARAGDLEARMVT